MKALRWILVLPFSLLSFFVANVLWQWLYSITASRYLDPNSMLNLIIVDIMSSAISTAAFVYIGALIAPSYKKITALILATLAITLLLISLFVVNVLTAEYISNFGLIAGMVGALVCYNEIQEKKEKS